MLKLLQYFIKRCLSRLHVLDERCSFSLSALSSLSFMVGPYRKWVCVCVSLEWDGGKEEGKRRMLNKIINSCHWRERQERESGKSQLWEPAVRVDHRRGKLASQRVSGKLLESFKLPVEIFTPPKKKTSSQTSIWMVVLQVLM